MSPLPAPDPVTEGGGSGGIRVYSKAFAYNTPGLNTGTPVWTPAVGDVLLDAWFVVTEAFDGTTPYAEIGTFVGSPSGLFHWWGLAGAGVLLAAAAGESAGAGVLVPEATPQSMSALYVAYAANAAGAGNSWQMAFTATNPLKLIVSQNGLAGSDPIGGTTGAGKLYLMVATPTAL